MLQGRPSTRVVRIAGAMVAAVGLTAVTMLAATAASTAPASTAPASPAVPIAGRVLAEFGAGTFAESVAMGPDGDLYVSVAAWSASSDAWNVGQVWRVTPDGDAEPFGPPLEVTFLTGVAFDQAGRLYAAVNTADWADTPSSIVRIDPDGTATTIATLAPGSFPNGLAWHEDALYVSDSATAGILRIPGGEPGSGPPEVWLSDPSLRPMGGLGVNGIAFHDGALYAVNSDFGNLLRFPLAGDGAAGPVEILFKDVLAGGDGITFAPDGSLWVAIGANLVQRITPDGAMAMVPLARESLDLPTQPVISPDGGTLYLTNGVPVSFELDSPPSSLMAFDIEGLAGR